MRREKATPNGASGNNCCFLLFIEVIRLQLNTGFSPLFILSFCDCHRDLHGKHPPHAVKITNTQWNPHCSAVASVTVRRLSWHGNSSRTASTPCSRRSPVDAGWCDIFFFPFLYHLIECRIYPKAEEPVRVPLGGGSVVFTDLYAECTFSLDSRSARSSACQVPCPHFQVDRALPGFVPAE